MHGWSCISNNFAATKRRHCQKSKFCRHLKVRFCELMSAHFLSQVRKRCKKCDVEFGRYFCEVCRLYDDVDKKQFHCEQCGICRYKSYSRTIALLVFLAQHRAFIFIASLFCSFGISLLSCTLGYAYNEYDYDEHPAKTSTFKTMTAMLESSVSALFCFFLLAISRTQCFWEPKGFVERDEAKYSFHPLLMSINVRCRLVNNA